MTSELSSKIVEKMEEHNFAQKVSELVAATRRRVGFVLRGNSERGAGRESGDGRTRTSLENKR